MTQFKKGDRVVPVADDPRVPAACRGRVFKVEKVNPKNLRCSAEDGGRGINFPADLLLPAIDENVAASSSALGLPFRPQEHYALGEIVTLKKPYKDWTDETPLVVVGGRGNKVNVAILGGDQDRYVRVTPAGLVRRDTVWLQGQLYDPTKE